LSKKDIVYLLHNLDRESNIQDYTLTRMNKNPEEIFMPRSARPCGRRQASPLRHADSYVSYSINPANLTIKSNTFGSASAAAFGRYPPCSDNFCPYASEELNNLVRNNYLYYNPTRAEYKLQGGSMEIGLERYLQDMDSFTP
jgi:hypothetical protein